jgi:tetratricopeptide (TPR) repeat protein
LGHAALGRWFLEEGDPQFARKLLDDAVSEVGDNQNHPYFLAARIQTLMDLGEFSAAAELFEHWPEPRGGYEYWKWRAIIFDDVQADHTQALAAYDEALRVWPGSADWRTRFRKANCLARIRKHELAEQERAAAQAIEQLMEDDIHKHLRQVLSRLRDAKGLEELAAYYDKLGRTREAAGWREYIRGLQLSAGPPPASFEAAR